MTAATLCISLCFRFGYDVRAWRRTFDGIVRWEPRLSPTHVYRRDVTGASPDEDWSHDLWQELARRCVEERLWSWGLENRTGTTTSLDIGCGIHQSDILIAVDRPCGDLVGHLLALFAAIADGAEPTLAFIYDPDRAHADFGIQGLHRLTTLSPIFYADETLVERIGWERIASSPCRVAPARHGVILDIVDPSSDDAAAEVATVAQALGISSRTPLIPQA